MGFGGAFIGEVLRVGASRRKRIPGESVIDSIDCRLIKWGGPTDGRIDGGRQTHVTGKGRR